MGLLPGADQPVAGDASPLNTRYTLTGTDALGPDWDVTVVRDRLIVGSPMGNTVRSFNVALDEDDTPDDAEGLISGENEADQFGASVMVLPDVDGDGEADLLVGAPTFTVAAGTRQDGAVYLFSGLGSGFTGKVNASDAALRIAGDTIGARLGSRLASCSDMDQDGLGEWASTAEWDNAEASLSGRAILVLSSELEALTSQVLSGAIAHQWTGGDIGERAGQALSCTHDVTGDGVADLMVGSPFADDDEDNDAVGAIHVISGADLPESGSLETQAFRRLTGTESEGWFGWSIATGDANGDGIVEVAVGAPGRDANTGRVLVWDGAEFMGGVDEPMFELVGTTPGDGFGRTVEFADIDGDGFEDLFIGAPFVNPTQTDSAFDSGHMAIFRGGEDYPNWDPEMTIQDADLLYEEPQQYLRTGGKFTTGDFDGDALADLVFLHRTVPE